MVLRRHPNQLAAQAEGAGLISLAAAAAASSPWGQFTIGRRAWGGEIRSDHCCQRCPRVIGLSRARGQRWQQWSQRADSRAPPEAARKVSASSRPFSSACWRAWSRPRGNHSYSTAWNLTVASSGRWAKMGRKAARGTWREAASKRSTSRPPLDHAHLHRATLAAQQRQRASGIQTQQQDSSLFGAAPGGVPGEAGALRPADDIAGAVLAGDAPGGVAADTSPGEDSAALEEIVRERSRTVKKRGRREPAERGVGKGREPEVMLSQNPAHRARARSEPSGASWPTGQSAAADRS